MEAQARGLNEILVKQAEGFKEIVSSTDGNTDAAIRMMIADKMENLLQQISFQE